MERLRPRFKNPASRLGRSPLRCRKTRGGVFGSPNAATQGGETGVQPPHEMDHIEVLKMRLSVLEREHRDLDEAIRALEHRGTGDAFTDRKSTRLNSSHYS